MTFHEKRVAKRFAKIITRKAVQDWIKGGNFDEWFWDRVSEYVVREDEIEYIDKNLTKWVDKWFCKKRKEL